MLYSIEEFLVQPRGCISYKMYGRDIDVTRRIACTFYRVFA